MEISQKSLLFYEKIKSKASKEEMFVFGVIIGNSAMAEAMLKADGASEETIGEVMSTLFSEEEIIKSWNDISHDLKLDVRSAEELF